MLQSVQSVQSVQTVQSVQSVQSVAYRVNCVLLCPWLGHGVWLELYIPGAAVQAGNNNSPPDESKAIKFNSFTSFFTQETDRQWQETPGLS